MSTPVDTLFSQAYEGEVQGTAYFRMTPEMRSFFHKCQEEYHILGFDWDGESLNLGLILADKVDPEQPTNE